MSQDVYERERQAREQYRQMLEETSERLKELNRAAGEWADTVTQVREYERGEQLDALVGPWDELQSAAGALTLPTEWRRRVNEVAHQLETTWEGWR